LSTDSAEHDLRVLGRAIRELREQRGLSVAAVAAAAGVSAAELTAIEAGRQDPGYRRMRRLAAALGVRARTLMLRVEQIDADGDD
jgi:transcriptional regulator with XRE-family HTH domain